MRSIVLAAVLSLMGIAAHAQTPTLVDFATISMSAPGVPRTVTDTVCVTDGRDLTCDRQMFVLPGTKVGIGLMPSFTTANGAAILTVATDGPSSSSSLGNSAVEIESKNRNASLIISNPYSYTGQMIFRNGGLETTSGQSSVAYQNGFLRVFVSSSTPALTVTSNSQVGLGLSFLGVPQTALQVSGTIRFANGGEACDANRTGAIRYTGGDFSFCRNGTAWEPLSSLGGGASKLASLTDVVASGAVSGSVLVYNAATTSWTALPLQSVMSTTTMVAGWPDAIRCNVTSPAWGYRVLYLQEAPYLDGTVVYREPSSEPTSESRSVVYNSDGSYNSAGEYTTHTASRHEGGESVRLLRTYPELRLV